MTRFYSSSVQWQTGNVPPRSAWLHDFLSTEPLTFLQGDSGISQPMIAEVSRFHIVQGLRQTNCQVSTIYDMHKMNQWKGIR